MNNIRLLLFLLLLVTSVFSQDEIYFFPKDGLKVEQKLINMILKSKKEIIVSMYNLSHKKISKALIKAKSNGVKVNVFLDSQKVTKNSKIYKKLMKNKIDVKLISKYKLHTKLIIFDRKVLFFGSANFTKESFRKQYEIVTFSNNNNFIEKILFYLKKYLI